MNTGPQSTITVAEARVILGTTAKGVSDIAIRKLIAKVDTLTDIVLRQAKGSKTQTSIDNSNKLTHTKIQDE